MDNLQNFCGRIFSKSGTQYFWQGEISVCKVLVPIKIVPVKNNYFRYPNFKSHTFQQMNGFLYWRIQGLIRSVFDISMPMYSLFGLLNDNIESSL